MSAHADYLAHQTGRTARRYVCPECHCAFTLFINDAEAADLTRDPVCEPCFDASQPDRATLPAWAFPYDDEPARDAAW